MQNDNITQQDQTDLQIQALLKDYPMPTADAGFYDQALVRAMLISSRRQRNRWLLTGFGAAIAATIAVWMIGGMLLISPEEPRTVNLVFASAAPLESATLTVSLPDGIELDGFPGQREITWETSLSEGRNLLPLTLVALTPTGGELLARLEHENRDRTFRLRVEVSEKSLERTSS
jgi:hypothetical protein